MVRLNADVKYLERVACEILKRGKTREAETQALADGFGKEEEEEEEGEEGEGAAAKDLFADLAQMVDYVLRCVPESILDEQVRASLYPRIDLRKLSMLLMKYAEPYDEGTPLGRNAPTRKDFEHVVERIGSDLVRQEAAKGRWGKGKIYA